MSRNKKWIITEHRQIVVDCSAHPLTEGEAFRAALDGSQMSYIVSDHIKRNIYPIHEEEN